MPSKGEVAFLSDLSFVTCSVNYPGGSLDALKFNAKYYMYRHFSGKRTHNFYYVRKGINDSKKFKQCNNTLHFTLCHNHKSKALYIHYCLSTLKQKGKASILDLNT